MEFDVPSTLVQLLFVRAAWGLGGPPGLPHPSPPPETGASARPGAADLDVAWSALWRAAALGEQTSDDQSWRTVLGAGGIDVDALREWSNATRQRINTDVLGQGRPPRSTLLASRAQSGEAAGLASIVVIPIEGWYAARVAAHRLVVSEATYLDDTKWAEALAVG